METEGAGEQQQQQQQQQPAASAKPSGGGWVSLGSVGDLKESNEVRHVCASVRVCVRVLSLHDACV